jgi:hypothetical protein
VLFIALALWQARVHAPEGWLRDVAALTGLGLVLSVAARGWIAWNRGIYRRRHRRTTALILPVAFAEDVVGRPIQAPPGTRRHTGEVVISIDELTGVKCYRPVHPGARELAAAMVRGVSQRV